MNQFLLLATISGLVGLGVAGLVWFGMDLAAMVVQAIRDRPAKSAVDAAAEALLQQAKDREEKE